MRLAPLLVCLGAMIASVAHAADAPVYISAADIAALAAKSAERQKVDPKSTQVTPLLQQGAFHANLEYREGPSPDVHAHETEGELFVVLQGKGTMTLGGELVGATAKDGTRHAKTSTGGALYHLAPGDVILLPEDMPHSVVNVDGRLVMMSMHLPHPAQATPPPAEAK